MFLVERFTAWATREAFAHILGKPLLPLLFSVASGLWGWGVYVSLGGAKGWDSLTALVSRHCSLSVQVLLYQWQWIDLGWFAFATRMCSLAYVISAPGAAELSEQLQHHLTAPAVISSLGAGSLALSVASTPHGSWGWLEKAQTMPYVTRQDCSDLQIKPAGQESPPPSGVPHVTGSTPWLWLPFCYFFLSQESKHRGFTVKSGRTSLSTWWEQSRIRFCQNSLET